MPVYILFSISRCHNKFHGIFFSLENEIICGNNCKISHFIVPINAETNIYADSLVGYIGGPTLGSLIDKIGIWCDFCVHNNFI